MRDVPLDVARRRREAAAADDESPLGPPRRRAPSVRVAAAEVDDRRGGEPRVALEDERRAAVRRAARRGAEHRARPPLRQQLLAQVGALAVDDARARSRRVVVAVGGVRDEAGALRAAHHRHVDHRAQQLRHAVRVRAVEHDDAKVAAVEGAGRAAVPLEGEEVGDDGLRGDEERGDGARQCERTGREPGDVHAADPPGVADEGLRAADAGSGSEGIAAEERHAHRRDFGAGDERGGGVRELVEPKRGVAREEELGGGDEERHQLRLRLTKAWSARMKACGVNVNRFVSCGAAAFAARGWVAPLLGSTLTQLGRPASRSDFERRPT